MPKLSRKKRITLFAVATALLAFVLLEILSAMLYHALASPDEKAFVEKLREGRRGVLAPHPYALFMPAPDFSAYGFQQHNSLGFRGPELREPKSCPRVVCLGGSTTYGWMEKDPSKTFPAMMERFLSRPGREVEVVNAGVPMASSAEILATLQFRVLPIKPDMVFLHLGLNDVFAELMPGYKPDYTHDRQAWSENGLDFFKGRKLFLSFNTGKLLALTALRTDGEAMAQFGFVKPEHAKWREFCVDGDASSAERYAGFRENLRSVLAVCAARRIKAVLTPTNVRTEDLDKYPALAEAYRRNVEIMKRLAGEYPGVSFFDSRTIGIPESCFIDMCHVKPEGAALKARAFASFIDSRRLLGGAPPSNGASNGPPPIRISRRRTSIPHMSSILKPSVPKVVNKNIPTGSGISVPGGSAPLKPSVSMAGKRYIDAYAKSGKDAHSLNKAAMCYMREGIVGEAARALRESLALDPGQVNAHGMLGTIYAYHKCDYPAGAQEFSAVLDLMPGQTVALSGRGWCELMMGDYASAKRDFEERVAKEPASGYANMSMGALEYFRGTRAKALEWFGKGVEKAPKYPPNHLWRLVLTGGVPPDDAPLPPVAEAFAKLFDGKTLPPEFARLAKRTGLDSGTIFFFLGEWAKARNDSAAAAEYFTASMKSSSPSVFRLMSEKELNALGGTPAPNP